MLGGEGGDDNDGPPEIDVDDLNQEECSEEFFDYVVNLKMKGVPSLGGHGNALTKRGREFAGRSGESYFDRKKRKALRGERPG